MNTENEGVTLLELLGVFHFSTAIGLILLIASAAISAFLKRRKSGLTLLQPFVFLALSGAIFFWGQATSHWNRMSFALVQRLTGGTDYSDTSMEYARHSAIEATFSSVAFLAALVSILFQLTPESEAEQDAAEQPATADESK
ncbi:MAG: hypothetical protein WD342_05005 [Verrucomicrobiales bacterium]